MAAEAMLKDLLADNGSLITYLRSAQAICDRVNDVATASLIEIWIDEAERRAWFRSQARVGNAARVWKSDRAAANNAANTAVGQN